MHILVTGAAGRIGSMLAQALGDRHTLSLTDIAVPAAPAHSIPVQRRDLAVDELHDLCAGVDTIIHLAGHPNSRDWDVVERANVKASRRLIEAALATGVRRFLYASSVHVCGLHPADVELSEALPYAPDSPYGASKAMVEMQLRYAAARHGMTALALRICSFRPAPGNARELRTWISPADTVRYVEAALAADLTGFATCWGVSNNRRARVDRSGWDRIGYAPQDDAEDHVEQLSAAGVDISLVSEWPLLGGAFV